MTEAALEQEGPLHKEEVTASPPWVRRTLLAIFCLGLLAAIGAVFTQVIAARVPEQRATLEKLITDRTGLAVRFDNVHFAWGMEGTSAIFEHVELTDPVRGRVRVVAPELRVEFDTWDFLRHQQFSLGHVTLSSPDIDIIGDAEPLPASAPARTRNSAAKNGSPLPEDEAAMVRRFTAWADLMPVGRVEVEGARVHLFRRGERVARHNFTLSQAVVSRGAQNFNAFGTLLLSQDIGQSLFVSAKLDKIGPGGSAAGSGVDGELRVIARRVFLDKLSFLSVPGPEGGSKLAARGRGTVDAKLSLRGGRIHDGSWQLSARELQMPAGTRFDHFTVQGRLSRMTDGFELIFTDLQLTRGARLERAPSVITNVRLVPRTLQPERITARAERVPFMAAQFIAGLLAPQFDLTAGFDSADWSATAGELHDLRFDSRARTLSARVSGAELTRASDQARVGNLAMRVEVAGDQTRLTFDDAPGAQMHMGVAEPRPLQIAGALTMQGSEEFDFAGLHLRSGDASVSADGSWAAARNPGRPLTLELAGVDRSLLSDVWSLLALAPPAHFSDLQGGRVVGGKLSLMASAQPASGIDWQRSRGTLELADLESAGADVPRLLAAGGQLEFARGAAQLRLTRGTIEALELTDARIDWPRRGPPRLRASAQGDLASPLLRRALDEQGLARLAGKVSLEAEARGEAELRRPESWRITARIRDASIPLGAGLPPVESLDGTVRVADGALRGLALAGSWLGGPVEIETRRTGARAISSAHVRGVADAAPLLELLGQAGAAGQVSGQLAWNGTVQRHDDASGTDRWQLSLTGNLGSLESRLPAPFAKPRGRALPVVAQLRFDTQGIREFEITSGRDTVQGRVQQGRTQAHFDIQGVSGELRAATEFTGPSLAIDRLDVQRAPAVLAAAGALLPADRELAVRVAELRRANRGLGALTAQLSREGDGLEFSVESADGSPHRVDATGRCGGDARCRMQFAVDTRELPSLLGDTRLPAEWPTHSLRASGDLAWRAEDADLVPVLTGRFEIETQGADSSHQLMASAVLADGQIELTNVQGYGPEPDQVFRGSGRVGLVARTYDLTVDYEQVSLAASAMPTPARMRLSRALSSLRGSAARRGWTETVPARRVQWHGSWE